jgi:exopolysaccharide production protein ExoZ
MRARGTGDLAGPSGAPSRDRIVIGAAARERLPSGKRQATIESIQILRGLAALMVVIYHALSALSGGYPEMQFQTLQGGVDIFFVISGVIMWVSVGSKDDSTPLAFLVDRVRRIAPLYWIFTLILALAAVSFPYLMKSATVTWPFLASSLLFLPYPHPKIGKYWPLLIPGWSLNLEMFFYILFALSLWIGGRSQGRRITTAYALFAATVIVHLLLPDSQGALKFVTDPMVLEFAAGVAIGIAYTRKIFGCDGRLWLVSFGAIGLLLIAPNYLPPLPRVIAFGVPSIAVVGAAVFAGPLNLAALRKLGDISYSLYLTHPLVIPVIVLIFRELHTYDPPMILAASVIASVCFGLVTYRFVERPIDKKLRTMTLRKGLSSIRYKRKLESV